MPLPQDSIAEAIEAEIQLVAKMPLEELRRQWSVHWGLAPRFRSVDLLRRLIAWRLQAEHYGGLDQLTKHLLASRRMPSPPGPEVGTRLTREYRGVLHEVEVVSGGFEYRQRCYRSLSKVAQAITGTHWNGPRFFGLRDAAPPQ